MPNAKGDNMVVFGNLNGGLNTRTTPLLTEANAKDRMQSVGLRNVDMFDTGGIAKRLGKKIQGNALASTTYASQLTFSDTLTITSTSSSVSYIAQKITTIAAVTIQSITAKLSLSYPSGTGFVLCQLCADSGGSPGTALNVSQVFNIGSSLIPAPITFNFATPPALSGTTDYWFVYQFSGAIGQTAKILGTAVGSFIKTDTNAPSTWAAQTFNGYYVLLSSGSGSPVNGIYDFRFSSSSTQEIIAASGGSLFYHARNATPLTGNWTNLTSGLGSGQNVLYAFTTLKNYLFSLDYGTNVGRVWDGSANYTIQQGVRPVGTFVRSATGGTVAAGTYKIMLITTMISGGYRSSIEYSVTTTAANDKIVASGVVVNNTGATDFGFDAGSACTQVFMTLAGGSTYYQLATGSVSVGNPLPNGTTSFNITAPPAGTESNTLAAFTKNQAYFTSQVTTPTCKYISAFQNMVCMAGDSANPNRIWFSELSAPMIWSTTGGTEGNFIDLQDPSEIAGDILNGLKVWNGNLYAFKRHSIYIIEYTGVAQNPFVSRKLTGNIGTLSHWSIKETQKGLVFLSERGPAICFGTFATIVPSAAAILNKFDPNDSTRYNLTAMQYTTSGINSTKSQIWWGVSSTSATTRDLTLVYDFEHDCFWEHDVSANYYTEITDGNSFPSIWSGDYSAQVFQMDNGTNDNGSAISFYFDTPKLSFGMPFHKKQITQIFISGDVQSSGTLYVDIYLDNSSSVSATYTYNMADPNFKGGLSSSSGFNAKMFKLRLRNSDLDVPVQIDSIGISYQDRGTQF